MIHFFEESLQAVDHVGESVAFTMEFVENQLHLMLRNHDVEVVFKPPYSPEFNSCEFCFRWMKAYLRQHEQFSIKYS